MAERVRAGGERAVRPDASPSATPPAVRVTLQGSEYRLAAPESTAVGYSDGQVTVELYEAAERVDLTALGAVPGLEGLMVKAAEPLGELILPAGAVRVTLELDRVGRLDASRASDMTQLTLHGAVEEGVAAPALTALTCEGTPPGRFGGCPALTDVTLPRPVDLTALGELSAVTTLYLARAEGDEPWDLTPLRERELTALRLGARVTAEELAGLTGCAVATLQVSDAGVHDLSVLEELPQVTALLLQVSSDQPSQVLAARGRPCDGEVLTLVNTPIPAEQLTGFARRGTVYLFPDKDR